MSVAPERDPFHVERWIDVLGGFVSRRTRFAVGVGNLETRLLRDELADITVDRPLFITGLARSGSTILLESLAEHPAVATHRYCDYPGVFAPALWRRVSGRLLSRGAPVERAHQDGLKVTAESPEAIEEMLWMAFFPDSHDPIGSAVLDGDIANPAFAAFYRDHIRKLLWLRRGQRWLSKGNYNLARLDYLLALFPDARFVIPVREPAWHIASLIKQHRLFCEGERREPAALRYMQRVGHFEFGLDRRPVNLGDDRTTAEIARLWAAGHEVEGTALYWAAVHDFLADRLEAHEGLRAAALVVRFEELCAAPRAALAGIFRHCALEASDDLLDRLAARIRFPTYYAPRYTDREAATIERLTGPVAARFGFGPDDPTDVRSWTSAGLANVDRPQEARLDPRRHPARRA